MEVDAIVSQITSFPLPRRLWPPPDHGFLPALSFLTGSTTLDDPFLLCFLPNTSAFLALSLQQAFFFTGGLFRVFSEESVFSTQ